MRPYTLPKELVEELNRITVPEAALRGAASEKTRPAVEWHEELVRAALAEDYSGRQVDVTTVATIPATQTRTADVVARQDGVVAGMPLAELVFRLVCEGVVEVTRHARDGDSVKRGDILMTVTARTRDLLTAERTALNFLTHLSGIATATRAWVDAVAGTGAANPR